VVAPSLEVLKAGLDYLRECMADRNYPLLGANIDGAHAQGIVDAPYQIF